MTILNTVKEKCKGVWTRVQGGENSITDYVLTDASSGNKAEEMKIDEENIATNENRKIYSNDNSILINLDFETPTEEERPKKIITKKRYERYRTIIEKENVSKLLKSGDLQESYNKWSIAIETSIKTVQKTKNIRKDIKELQKIRKRLREEYSTTEELHEKILILERIKTFKEHITEKQKEVTSKRINRIAQELRENVDNGGKIWEVKRRLEKKVQTPYSITNAKEIKLQNRLDIQEEFKKYYEKLLKTREPDNESERIIEEEVNKKFQELIRKTNQIECITDEMVKKDRAKLKNKRASDRLGWRAEWLKKGGEEIVKSLSILFSRIEREQRTLM